MFISPCVEFLLLWGYIAYFQSFLIFLENTHKEFPRRRLLFHLWSLQSGTSIVLPSPGWKEKPWGGPGSSLWQSAPKREDAGQQQPGSKCNLEKKVSHGAFWILEGGWSLWITAQSMKELKIMEVGEEEGSGYQSLDWMIHGEVHRENFSQDLIAKGWECNPAPS